MFRGRESCFAARGSKEDWMIQVLVVVGIIAAIVLLMLLATYNSLTQQRQDVRSAWGAVDEQFKQRYQLVPGLLMAVQAVGGDAAAKLPAVSIAKNQAAVAFNPAQLASAEIALTIAIHDVLSTAANDAGVTSDPGFSDIRQKLISSEKRIEKARKNYNDRVDQFNESMKSFPTVITAKLVGLRPQPPLQLPIE
jgi:LemA protein